jgi:Cu+-exporting ATPase
MPLTMSMALRRAWANGIIVKSAEALERAAGIDTVVLDKTGTLTAGVLRVAAGSSSAAGGPAERGLETSAVIEAAARLSRHPVSQALARELAARPREVDEVGSIVFDRSTELPGRGLIAEGSLVDESRRVSRAFRVAIGSIAHVGEQLGDDELGALREAQSAAPCAAAAVWIESKESGAEVVRHVEVFRLEDRIRPEAVPLLARWRARGLRVYVASGDVAAVVTAVGRQCGLAGDELVAEASPVDKQALVRELIGSGRRVMMVGDGINDAVALAEADVGVAVSGGVDLALASADVFLGRSGLEPVDQLLAFARYTMRSLRLILGLSVLYNAAAISLAIAGRMHPLVAALIMPTASVTVILVAAFRRGDVVWKSSSSSCPLPSPSPAPPC